MNRYTSSCIGLCRAVCDLLYEELVLFFLPGRGKVRRRLWHTAARLTHKLRVPGWLLDVLSGMSMIMVGLPSDPPRKSRSIIIKWTIALKFKWVLKCGKW